MSDAVHNLTVGEINDRRWNEQSTKWFSMKWFLMKWFSMKWSSTKWTV